MSVGGAVAGALSVTLRHTALGILEESDGEEERERENEGGILTPKVSFFLNGPSSPPSAYTPMRDLRVPLSGHFDEEEDESVEERQGIDITSGEERELVDDDDQRDNFR